jgi:alkylation response protein AidB-like acyl-CoA dehydrogenase
MEVGTVIDSARSILERLSASSDSSENLRRLDEAAVRALRDSGLNKLLAPKKFGGYELPLRAQILSCAEIAHGCSAASWVQMVFGAHTFVLGSFPEKCQQEVFSPDAGAFIAGSLAAQGTIKRAEGGWILNGRWQFCSGVDHASWLLIGARQVDVEGDPAPLGAAHVVAPTHELEIDDTWHVLGMRGTGSKDIVAKDLFIPSHRVMPTLTLFTGLSPHAKSRLYRLPALPALSSMLAGTVLGMTERALENYIEPTKVRRDMYGRGQKVLSVGIQRRVAESSGELASARLLLQDICDRFDEAMQLDEPPVRLEDRIELRWRAAYVVDLCRRSFDRVFASSGAHSIYNSSKLQRDHRDLHTASHHAIVDFDTLAELEGKAVLGIEFGAERVAPIA